MLGDTLSIDHPHTFRNRLHEFVQKIEVAEKSVAITVSLGSLARVLRFEEATKDELQTTRSWFRFGLRNAASSRSSLLARISPRRTPRRNSFDSDWASACVGRRPESGPRPRLERDRSSARIALVLCALICHWRFWRRASSRPFLKAATRRSEPQAAHVPDGVGARLDTTT